jgi:hypothetical protein
MSIRGKIVYECDQRSCHAELVLEADDAAEGLQTIATNVPPRDPATVTSQTIHGIRAGIGRKPLGALSDASAPADPRLPLDAGAPSRTGQV